MRVVHARKRIEKKDCAFTNKFNLLVWALSVLKWKEYGNELVMYADKETLADMKKFGLDKLYDEVNTDLFENGDVCQNIDFYFFWAMPKIISLHYETFHLGNNVLVADQDVVPIRDFSKLYNLADVLVWSNKEMVEDRRLYPPVHKLSLPKDYELPEWFTGDMKPLNTGVIYFRKKNNAIEYCDEVFKYAKCNDNCNNNNRAITMCNAEQRMLGEWLKHKNLTYMTVQPANEGLFNKYAFHTHGYKNIVGNENGTEWHIRLLKMIKECNEDYYNKLLCCELFATEKAILKKENNL